ncbi:ABC transporter permease [bacterium]|nr:ABC transporter permease [bacterium]
MNQRNQSPHAATADDVLSGELFKPQPAQGSSAEQLSRPVVGYWKDALLRLSKNRIAVFSLTLILFVALVGIVGPFFFPKTNDDTAYENAQNLNFLNQSPTFGEKLLVTEDSPAALEELVKENFDDKAPLLKADLLKAPAQLSVRGLATVNGVSLQWEPILGVSGYQVYRTVVAGQPISLEDVSKDPSVRGLQVGTVSNPAQYTFTDGSGLNPAERYIYSVVAFVTDPATQEELVSTDAAALEVGLTQTISLTDAASLKTDVQAGDTIRGHKHIFGTDALGRDIFSRMVSGTRIDFFLALLVPTVSLLFGLCYGAISGLMGGKVDMILMRIVEILDTLPELLLLVLIQVAIGKGVSSLVIALCAFSWTGYARVLRGEVLRLREIEFVHASRLLGAPLMSIIFRHVAPNLLGVIIVMWSAHIPRIITSEAFLSLFGLGVEAPMATWGTVLQDAAVHFQQYPAQFFLPAAVLAATLLAFYTLGDALRDAFDPKLRGRD